MRRAFVTTVVVRSALLVPPVAIIVVLFVFRPADERLLYGGGLLSLLVFAVAVLAALRLWHARTLESVTRSTRQGAVVFLTQSLPTSLVHLDPYIVAGAPLPRGRIFTVVADEAGISHWTGGRRPARFVLIPWSAVVRVTERRGDLLVTLTDDSPLYLVPGGLFPFTGRRVRELVDAMDGQASRHAL